MMKKIMFLGFCMMLAACGQKATQAPEIEFVDDVKAALSADGQINLDNLEWTREPAGYEVKGDTISITTAPHTDLWQRTYYHFQNDNAPVLQMKTREKFQHLGSVATNNGYSDWATTAISADVKTMWYRFSRREDDYCIECSSDGLTFSQMRICHMYAGADEIRFGIYACSPEESSFTAVFSDMKITECAWKAHDGQQPDKS